MPRAATAQADVLRTYELSVDLEGPDVLDPERIERLAEATECSALFGRSGGRQFADFDLEATSLEEAVEKARRMIEDAAPELRVVGVRRIDQQGARRATP